jgi:alcohol dehydrogenase
MLDFEFENKTKVIFGIGKVNELGELCKKIGKKLMLVTYNFTDEPGFKAIFNKVIKILNQSGFDPVVFDKAIQNPTTTIVDLGAEVAQNNKVDLIIGLGGGSAVDTAKAIAICAKTKRRIWDFLSGKNHTAEEIKESLPIIAIDTTAGTGTAVTMFFVLTNPSTSEKAGNGAPIVWPVYSIVDPELMLSVPKNVTASTGLDTFYHAFEAYLAKNSNPISDLFSFHAMKLVSIYLQMACNDGSNLKARENMALASILGGYAINNASAVLPHAIAHSISAFTNTAHGLAISAIIEPWIEFTYPVIPERINEVINILGTDLSGIPMEKSAKLAVLTFHDFKSKVGVDITLKKIGLKREFFKNVIEDTFAVMGGIVDQQPGNPVTKKDVEKILLKAYEL